MIDLSDCIELGIITKCHGIRGQVVLRLNDLGFDDIKEMESVFVIIDGLPVPFFISEYEERSKDTLLLTIDEINGEKEAKELIESRVFIRSSHLKQSPHKIIQSNILVGYHVIDSQLGEIGVINEILQFEQNPLLRILNKKKEILLPLNDNFILDIDSENRILHVKAPEGITDIY